MIRTIVALIILVSTLAGVIIICKKRRCDSGMIFVLILVVLSLRITTLLMYRIIVEFFTYDIDLLMRLFGIRDIVEYVKYSVIILFSLYLAFKVKRKGKQLD